MGIGTGAAILGGAVVSGVMGKKSADKSSKTAANASANELAFAKQQYEDWKEVFGDLQTNLGEYYKSLDTSKMTAEALQAFEKEKNVQLNSLRDTLEQRGISTSGLAKEVEEDFAYSSAVNRARIRADAPMKKAAMQQQFLQIGLGQNPAGNIQSTLAGQAQDARQDAVRSNAAYGQSMGNLVNAGVNFATAMSTKPTYSPYDPNSGGLDW